MYSSDDMWYQTGDTIDEGKVDVFYIVSTEVSNTQDVKYETINGDECAFVSSYYFVREGSGYSRTYMDFTGFLYI